jgi:hypothetical protein
MIRAWHIPAILAAVLLLGPAGAIGAPENEAADSASQPQQDDKSYLPPWMQKQNDTKTASTDGSAQQGIEIADPSNPDTKLKIPGTKPQQRRHGNDAFYWPSFGFFGR